MIPPVPVGQTMVDSGVGRVANSCQPAADCQSALPAAELSAARDVPARDRLPLLWSVVLDQAPAWVTDDRNRSSVPLRSTFAAIKMRQYDKSSNRIPSS
jgi:hypothetical protein